MRQQRLEERSWERLAVMMRRDGWNPVPGPVPGFDAPGPGGLVLQVWPGMRPLDGSLVMFPALSVSNAEVRSLLGALKDLPGLNAVMYGRALDNVMGDRGSRVSPYDRMSVKAGQAQ